MSFDYEAEPKERIGSCNLCGSSDFVRAPGLDRYGYTATADQCMSCGLVFLNPRMTREGYAQFYANGYRPLLSTYYGRVINEQTIQDEQRRYGEELARWLVPHTPVAASLLDVGGSTGVVARCLIAHGPARYATVLDPAPAELAVAAGSGIGAIPGFIEDCDPRGRRWGLVTMCQTIDHLLDVAAALGKIRECLAIDGRFFVDIVDHGRVGTLKIDHPFYLTPRTMGRYLRRAGFAVMAAERAPDDLHVRFVCR